MKKITNFFYTFIVLMLFFFSNTTKADNRSMEINKSIFDWKIKSYAPELYLQPYFDLNNSNVLAKTLATPSVVFADDFEGTSKWTFVNASNNAWYISTAVKNGGTKSLYISDDKGVTNSYSNGTAVSHAVSEGILIPSGTKDYSLSFDWRAQGEGTTTLWDHLAAWIVPESYTPVAGVKMTASNTGGILASDKLNLQNVFKRDVFIMDLGKMVGKKVKIVFQWANDASVYNIPPAAVDNVELKTVACSSPLNFEIKNLGSTSATATWQEPYPGPTQYELYLATVNTAPTANPATVINVANATTYSWSNLSVSQNYFLWYRTVCSATEKSTWVGPIAFKTSCATMQFPFSEGFNTGSTTKDCWNIINNNNDSSTWTTTTGSQEGTHAMYFYGSSSTIDHDDWLVSPTFQADSTKIYQLKYFYKTSTFSNNSFEVLLSNDGPIVTGFKKKLLSKVHSGAVWVEETLFFQGVQGTINIGWKVNTSNSSTYLYLDNVRIEAIDCADPVNLDVKDIEPGAATILWEDTFNTAWEYVVQPKDDGNPAGAGTVATNNEVIVTKTTQGANLQGNTEYEFYVRSKCSDGTMNNWTGPFVFKTTCNAIALPYSESFETASKIKDCWKVLDGNQDGSGTTNLWAAHTTASNAQDGSISMRFYGTDKVHDDWLFSPSFNIVAADIYELSYFYKTTTGNVNEFEVLLSLNGLKPVDFKKELVAKEIYKNGTYIKKTVYITGLTGEANIGWHVTGTGTSYVYLDMVTIKKVGCVGPQDPTITKVESGSVSFEWTDVNNSNWEYFIQPQGGTIPVGSGSLSKVTKVTATKTSGTGGTNLLPNTEYEFYLRSSCGVGKNSDWIGPFRFKTLCSIQALPFWEGFNKDGSTWACWTIVDGNSDSTLSTSNIWHQNTPAFEGDQSARFYGSGTAATVPHNDWLISPIFKFNATKIYRLKYNYRTNSASTVTYSYEFAVLLSKAGADVSKFTETVVPKKSYEPSNDWKQQTAFITSVGGDINLAWHVTSPTLLTYVYVDNVFIEEITCPEPLDLGTKDEKDSSATIFWNDKFGSDWEYVVQKVGGNAPVATTVGTATKNKEIVVTVDKDGKALEQNTEYEFYVRTDCGNEDLSDWSGPYKFRTACGVFKAPFKEGFDTGSASLICWTILDGNADSTSPTSSGIWKTSTIRFEGTHSMYFTGTKDNAPHNDWLISPKINFEAGKSYRLKYKYRTAVGATNINEFEVMLSNTGTAAANFTHTVVAKAEYTGSADWKEEYVFIQGISGDVNIGWHVTSATTAVNLYIDNVVVEEVKGCIEPLPSTVDSKDYQSNGATIFWDDKFGATNWEYFVQEVGGKYPSKNGTVTTKKENIVNNVTGGASLKPNTDYEYYIRTICSAGGYSIWQGPFYFTTLCGVDSTPYWEGFNLLDKTYRCWSVIDANADATATSSNNRWAMVSTAAGVYEGTHSMYFYGSSGKTHDDWLVSPPITLDGGMYVLKYHYKATAANNNNLEVLLSTKGIDPKDFTTQVVASRKINNATFVEEVAFINGVSGVVNFAWHVPATGITNLYVDNIFLKKVENCPEPYYVKVSNETTSSIDVSWTQDGGITSWEVIVVDYGDDAKGTPIKTIPVTGAPNTIITGLPSGRGYSIFVRAKCTDGTSTSDWSTPAHTVTTVAANNDCSGAIVIPVNKAIDCEQSVSATFFGATKVTVAAGTCIPVGDRRDIWFEFTATNDTHMFKIKDWVSLSGHTYANLNGVLYNTPCSTVPAVPVECFTFTTTEPTKSFKNLVPGTKYYVRLMIANTTAATFRDVFKICITTPPFLLISPSGADYSVEDLVKKVLISSNCDLVTNVNYQNGDGGVKAMTYNTLGSFSKGTTEFPFEKGIVLSTNEIQAAAGPAQRSSFDNRGNNNERWAGDKDINDAISAAGGGPAGYTNKRVTQLEFDFFAIKDSIKFEYLFASNSYHSDCSTVGCTAGALFAAYLVDSTTGEGRNLAKIKGTDTPIALSTIIDPLKTGKCVSSYPELYWKHYAFGQDERGEAFVDFVGLTREMESETVYVVPGRTYHIKLAVIDFCTTVGHSSAVFFNAGSFDLGNLDLGADLLVENGNALCNGESRTINTGLGTEDVTIKWFKDDVLMPGETSPSLEVWETGTYKVVAKYDAIDCEVVGEVKVEIFPPISTVVARPIAMEFCKNSLVVSTVDLSTVEKEMFVKADRDNYTVTYYTSLTDAQSATDSIDTTYELLYNRESVMIYVLVEDNRTGCREVFELPLKVSKGEIPVARENTAVCATYTLPALEENQYYYTESKASGIQYQAGDVLTEAKTHKIYILQRNDEEGCYEEISYDVTITAAVTADVFENVELECHLHQLAPLTANNRYFTQSGGQGIELAAGSLVPYAQTIYVYASSEDGLCIDESSFKVSYLDCPIQKGISPNGDGKNDRFDLSEHGVTSMLIYNRYGAEVFAFQGNYKDQWYGQDKAGKALPDGTYYYVVIAHGKTRTGWVQINK